jgi:hypothetical protein
MISPTAASSYTWDGADSNVAASLRPKASPSAGSPDHPSLYRRERSTIHSPAGPGEVVDVFFAAGQHL